MASRTKVPNGILGFLQGHVQKNTQYCPVIDTSLKLQMEKACLFSRLAQIHANQCIWGAQEVDINLTSLNQSRLLHLKHQVFCLGCKKQSTNVERANGGQQMREHKKTWEKQETKRAKWGRKGQE